MDPVDAVKARQTGRSESEKESFTFGAGRVGIGRTTGGGREESPARGRRSAPSTPDRPNPSHGAQEPSGGSWISRVAAATMAGAAPAA